jgi:hypothetical protein
MPTHLFNAFFNSQEGTELGGPVTVEMGEYLFVNKNSADDIYFNLIKAGHEWKFSGGPSTYTVPQAYIDAIGAQIDEFNAADKLA